MKETRLRTVILATGMMTGSLFPIGMHRDLTVGLVVETVLGYGFVLFVVHALCEAMMKTMPFTEGQSKNDEESDTRSGAGDDRGRE